MFKQSSPYLKHSLLGTIYCFSLKADLTFLLISDMSLEIPHFLSHNISFPKHHINIQHTIRDTILHFCFGKPRLQWKKSSAVTRQWRDGQRLQTKSSAISSLYAPRNIRMPRNIAIARTTGKFCLLSPEQNEAWKTTESGVKHLPRSRCHRLRDR